MWPPTKAPVAHLLREVQYETNSYETDPLVCPRCQGPMEMISCIEDPQVIKSILVHLKLWHVPARPPPGGIASSDTIADYGFFDGLVT